MTALKNLLILISGFDFLTNTGVLEYNGTVVPVANTRFLSYSTSTRNGCFAVDEGYGTAGSRLFRVEDGAALVREEAVEPACRGAVFIEDALNHLLIPCFGSDTLWIVDKGSFETAGVVETCHRPHGIYSYRDAFYVPCRGDRGDGSGEVRIYGADLRGHTSIRVDGPRHMVFVDDSFYVITEFDHRVFRYSVGSNKYLGHADILAEDAGDAVVTGAEIRYDPSRRWIIVSLRYEGRAGRLVFLDAGLGEIGRITVGRNPRFFDLYNGSILVLNQDDRGLVRIDPEDFRTEWIDLGMNPQSFCVA